MNSFDWRDYATCREVFPDVFFPETDERSFKKYVATFCARCEVKRQCAAYALAHDIRYGIWGGVDAANYRSRERLAEVAGGL